MFKVLNMHVEEASLNERMKIELDSVRIQNLHIIKMVQMA